jgi:hypothetical protein
MACPRPQFHVRWLPRELSDRQGEEGNHALRWCSLPLASTLSILPRLVLLTRTAPQKRVAYPLLRVEKKGGEKEKKES